MAAVANADVTPAPTLLRQRSPEMSGKMLKQMNTEALDDFCAQMMAEQRALMTGVDLNTLQRDPLATCNGSLTWQDVSFSVKLPDPEDGKRTVQKPILEECSGHIGAGQLVAFMGPSGCGKTTLMDILAGKKTAKYSGKVYFNGRERPALFPRMIAYVGQTDIMPAHWTVGEAVAFNCMLKKPMPAKVTQRQITAYLDGLLGDLGLLHVKDTKIGGEDVRGISGGQRRRVSLARGLVSGAHLMFCDEPTSGLSATDAELCVKVLKIMAKKWGVTIVVVIHQPRVEVARLFDQLVLLTAQPGRVVYNGSMAGATEHFQRVGFPVPMGANPTDHFLDMITPGADGADPDRFRAYYVEHMRPQVLDSAARAIAQPGPSPLELLEGERQAALAFGGIPAMSLGVYGVGFGTQFKLVLARKVKLTLRDSEVIGATIAMNTFLGVIMGVMFLNVGAAEPRGSYQLAFLFNILMQVAMGSMNIMPQLIAERTVMKAETDEALYSAWAFIWVSFLVMGAIAFLGNTIFTVLMWAFGNVGWAAFVQVYAWVMLSWFTMDSIFAAVAATAKKVETAQVIALPPLLIAIMFSGLMINKKSNSPLKFLCWVSPLYWATEMIGWDVYGQDADAWASLQAMYGFEEPSHAAGIAVNLGIALVFRVLQVLALKHLNNIQR